MAIYKCEEGHESEGKTGLKYKICRRCLKEMKEVFEDKESIKEVKGGLSFENGRFKKV